MAESNSDSEWATKASEDDLSNISTLESEKLNILEDGSSQNVLKIEILENIVICQQKSKSKCHFCEKNIDKDKIEEHRKVHELTFFHCQQAGCNKKFKRKSSLRKHNYFHKGKFKYECKVCNAQFIDKVKFQTHEKVKHKSLSREKYKCNDEGCGKSFATNDYLRRHLVTHKGLKNCLTFTELHM
jgi:uncharacterized Zn-finger protein